MKKQYINPVVEIIKVKMSQLMAGSPDLGGDYNGGEILSRDNADDLWEE